MERLAIAFTGPSNSGKTTLIERLSKKLVRDYKVVVIKHDPKDKAIYDTEGKDSDRFFKSGADVAVISNKRTTIFKHSSSTIEEIANFFDDFDFLFIEGLKNLPLPRIGIFNDSIDEEYIPYIQAIVIDSNINQDKLKGLNLKILDINNLDEILEYIKNNAKRI